MADLSFRSSLKPLDVEEVIDLLVHRPLGYLIARAAYPTAVTPDLLTWLSLAVGLSAGAAAWSSFVRGRPHLVLAGALFILSAVIDCSDGQLARMRRTSSPFGRMLDGAVDSVVQAAVVPGAVAHVLWRHGYGRHGGYGEAATWLGLAVLAAWTGLCHTTLYDHFKNVYLHHVQAQRKEGDDPEEVEAAYQRVRAEGDTGRLGFTDWLRFFAYRRYLRAQARLLRRADPWVPARFRAMPAYSPEVAARYRALHRGLMRAWSFYGIGTHIFGLGLALMLDRVELYLLARLLLWNGALLVLIPAQRRASRAFFGPSPAVPDARLAPAVPGAR